MPHILPTFQPPLRRFMGRTWLLFNTILIFIMLVLWQHRTENTQQAFAEMLCVKMKAMVKNVNQTESQLKALAQNYLTYALKNDMEPETALIDWSKKKLPSLLEKLSAVKKITLHTANQTWTYDRKKRQVVSVSQPNYQSFYQTLTHLIELLKHWHSPKAKPSDDIPYLQPLFQNQKLKGFFLFRLDRNFFEELCNNIILPFGRLSLISKNDTVFLTKSSKTTNLHRTPIKMLLQESDYLALQKKSAINQRNFLVKKTSFFLKEKSQLVTAPRNQWKMLWQFSTEEAALACVPSLFPWIIAAFFLLTLVLICNARFLRKAIDSPGKALIHYLSTLRKENTPNELPKVIQKWPFWRTITQHLSLLKTENQSQIESLKITQKHLKTQIATLSHHQHHQEKMIKQYQNALFTSLHLPAFHEEKSPNHTISLTRWLKDRAPVLQSHFSNHTSTAIQFSTSIPPADDLLIFTDPQACLHLLDWLLVLIFLQKSHHPNAEKRLKNIHTVSIRKTHSQGILSISGNNSYILFERLAPMCKDAHKGEPEPLQQSFLKAGVTVHHSEEPENTLQLSFALWKAAETF